MEKKIQKVITQAFQHVDSTIREVDFSQSITGYYGFTRVYTGLHGLT